MNTIFKYRYMLIVQYIYNFRCTCSSVEMLKEYVVREGWELLDLFVK